MSSRDHVCGHVIYRTIYHSSVCQIENPYHRIPSTQIHIKTWTHMMEEATNPNVNIRTHLLSLFEKQENDFVYSIGRDREMILPGCTLRGHRLMQPGIRPNDINRGSTSACLPVGFTLRGHRLMQETVPRMNQSPDPILQECIRDEL